MRGALVAGLCLGGLGLLGVGGLACEDASSPSTPIDGDAGGLIDAPSGPGSDGAPTTDGGGTDGAVIDLPTTIACGAPLELATSVSYSPRAAKLPNGRVLVSWVDNVSATKFTPAYRVYDGATWGAKQSFDADVGGTTEVEADDLGNVFAAYRTAVSPTKIARAVLPAGGSTFGSAELVDRNENFTNLMELRALSAGAILLYRVTNDFVASRWDPGSGSWGTSAILGPATGGAGEASLGTHGTKAAAVWFAPKLHVSTFDGTTWAAPVDEPDAPTTPTATAPRVGVFSNGDPFVAWRVGGNTMVIAGHRYRVATQTWDPVETIYSDKSGGDGNLDVLVDDADHVSVAFQGANTTQSEGVGAVVARKVAATWELHSLAGVVNNPLLDSAGNLFVITSPTTIVSAVVERVGSGSATWLAPTPTGLAPLSNPGTRDSCAVSFDGAGHLLAFGVGDNKLRVTVCQ